MGCSNIGTERARQIQVVDLLVADRLSAGCGSQLKNLVSRGMQATEVFTRGTK